jgi:hypothetical protein
VLPLAVRSRGARLNARLLRAYVAAPWATVPWLVVWRAVFLSSAGLDWTVGLGSQLLKFVAGAYLVGGCLLPLFDVFERRGWHGWRYYVPTAVGAAVVAQIGLGAVFVLWSMTSGSGGIGAVSLGCAAAVYPAVAGALCGVLFSVVLGPSARSAPPPSPRA